MFLETVDALQHGGRDLVVTLPSSGPLQDELGRRGVPVAVAPAPVLRKSALRPGGWPRFGAEVLDGWRRGSQLIRRVRPSAIYVNTLTIPLWLVLARRSGLPSVCHVHEAEDSASPLLLSAFGATVNLADAIVTNSEFSRKVLTRSSASAGGRAVVVYNGVHGPPEVLPPREVLTGPVRLLYVGRLSPRKGVHVALQALPLLRERGVRVRLEVVGSTFTGYEWYVDELRTLADREELADDLVLHDFASDVWPLMRTADVVVVPSVLSEPFGNVAVEAVRAARPVVVSDGGGLPEAVRGVRSARLCRPGDPDDLARAVMGIIEDWPSARSAACEGARLASARFSPSRYGAEMRRVLDSVTS